MCNALESMCIVNENVTLDLVMFTWYSFLKKKKKKKHCILVAAMPCAVQVLDSWKGRQKHQRDTENSGMKPFRVMGFFKLKWRGRRNSIKKTKGKPSWGYLDQFPIQFLPSCYANMKCMGANSVNWWPRKLFGSNNPKTCPECNGSTTQNHEVVEGKSLALESTTVHIGLWEFFL